jgi:CRP-like cAMP-binding protein
MQSAASFVNYLPADVMDWIAANAKKRTVPATETLVQEGAKAAQVYFVAAGAFEVAVTTPSGARQKISQLGVGAIIGEMSWLDGGPASAHIVAVEDGQVLALDGVTLSRKVASDPVFGAHFYKALAQEAFVRLRAGNSLLSRA